MTADRRIDPIDLDVLNLIILLIREHYDHHGTWPSALQLRALLLKPS